jgi:uracil-DNA glycosylase family 4
LTQSAKQNEFVLTSSLSWMNEIGVDEFLESDPQPWIDRKPYKPANKSTPHKVELKNEQGQPALVEPKYKDLPDELSALSEAWRQIDVPASHRATHFVEPKGQMNPSIMIIGETPSAEEDKTGEIYAEGPRRILLENMLKAISVDWDSCFYSYLLPWRPPGNREPSLEEIKASLPFLFKQIALVQPKTILLMGGIAGRMILGKDEVLSKLVGKWYSFSEQQKPAMVIQSLDTLLSTPQYKKQAWLALLRIADKLI